MSRSKAKGASWESRIVAALRDAGFVHAERRTLNGSRDLGDITGIPGLVIEAKNCAKTELATWIDETERERDNAGAEFGVVWHHRRGRAAAEDGFVTMSGSTFLALLHAAYGVEVAK
jgi:hypothetical protein